MSISGFKVMTKISRVPAICPNPSDRLNQPDGVSDARRGLAVAGWLQTAKEFLKIVANR